MTKINIRQFIFIFISIISIILFILFFTSTFSTEKETNVFQEENGCIIDTGSNLKPVSGHYLQAVINTENPESQNYVYGTVLLSWTTEVGEDTFTGQTNIKIYLDGLTHKYYLPLGIYQNWPLQGQIDQIKIALPQFEDTDIELFSVSLNQRSFFPVDIYFLGLIRSPEIPVYSPINRFMIQTYVFLFSSLFLAGIYSLLFIRHPKKRALQRIKRALLILIILILVFFSGTYIYREVLTVKSYWKAYGDDLISGRYEETYLGIYDFERFILWVNDLIPEDQNLILFIKGEPIYIMSEMAYNLYPRDIKFIDISGKTREEITDEIDSIKISSENIYGHLIILSEDEAWLASGYELMAQYRSTGGLIFSLK